MCVGKGGGTFGGINRAAGTNIPEVILRKRRKPPTHDEYLKNDTLQLHLW